MGNTRFKMLLAMPFALMASLVHAENVKLDQPSFKIEAKRIAEDKITGQYQYDGDVMITQDDIVIKTDHATVGKSPDGKKWIIQASADPSCQK